MSENSVDVGSGRKETLGSSTRTRRASCSTNTHHTPNTVFNGVLGRLILLLGMSYCLLIHFQVRSQWLIVVRYQISPHLHPTTRSMAYFEARREEIWKRCNCALTHKFCDNSVALQNKHKAHRCKIARSSILWKQCNPFEGC